MRYEFDCPPYAPAMIEAFDKSEMDPGITLRYGPTNHVKTVKYRVSHGFEQSIPATEPDATAWACRVAISQMLRDGPPEKSLEHRELDESRLEPWSGVLSGPV
jgi:hypothetical protein